MYVYKNICTTNIEEIFLNYALDVNVYLTPESNQGFMEYLNSIQKKFNLNEFKNWKDYYNFITESILFCDKHLSSVIRMENVHLFDPDRPTLCWYGCNPTFGTKDNFYGIVPILFSNETKEKCTPIFNTDGDYLFFEFSKEYAEYLNEEIWHYGDSFKYNCLDLIEESS